MAIIIKHCPGCNRDLPISEYHKHAGNSTGYQARCKTCLNAAAKERAKAGKIAPRKLCVSAEVERIWTERKGVKACATCGVVHPRSEFRATVRSKDGHHGQCRSCRNAVDRRSRKAEGRPSRTEYLALIARSPEVEAAKAWDVLAVRNAIEAWSWWLDNAPAWWRESRERTQADKVRAQWRATRHVRRARQRGAKVEPITPTRLDRIRSAATNCCWCDVPLTKAEVGKYRPTDATIEHIVPLADGGAHSLANIDVACARCNYSRPKRAA